MEARFVNGAHKLVAQVRDCVRDELYAARVNLDGRGVRPPPCEVVFVGACYTAFC